MLRSGARFNGQDCGTPFSDRLQAKDGSIDEAGRLEGGASAVRGFPAANVVPGEEAVEIALVQADSFTRAASAASGLEEARPSTAKRADNDRDRRRVKSGVRFCSAALQSEAKHGGLRRRLLDNAT